VGSFQCTGDPKISHGPGIALRIKTQLLKLNLTLDPDARFSVGGDYADKEDPKSKRVRIDLNVLVVDRQNGNQVVLKEPRGVYGEDVLVKLLAPAAVSFPPGLDDEKREQLLVKTIDEQRTKPAWVQEDAVTYASPAKLYGVEILVKNKDGYKPRKPKFDDGDLVVEVAKEEVFVIRLVNNSPLLAGAEVLIDGLDVFSFWGNEKEKGKLRWLVGAGTSADVSGWPTGKEKSYEFLVTNYANSAAAELGGDKAQLGVLTVTFHAAWPKDQPRPKDEGDLTGSKSADTGVGKGKLTDTPRGDPVECVFGRRRASISIRYTKK
jgi:hypothetical protein